ncbi:MAG: hypothetical protein SA339_08460 [Methanomassiliicoccus sp.]|nr:hypothetical protein [Methanomassiliicoccus sp.]
MVIMVTNDNGTNEPELDSKFRKNLRTQLQEREERLPSEYEKAERQREAEEFEEAMSMPFVQPALKWLGGVIGTLLFTFGLIWFMSFFGIVLPWYAAFSILLMIAGGAFIVAAATRKRR